MTRQLMGMMTLDITGQESGNYKHNDNRTADGDDGHDDRMTLDITGQEIGNYKHNDDRTADGDNDP